MFPPPLPDRDGNHLQLLAVFHYVLAGLGVLGLGFLGLHYAIMNVTFGDPSFWAQAQVKEPLPFNPVLFFNAFKWFYLFAALLMVLNLVGNLLSALYLGKGRHRSFSLMVAGFNCMNVPFGTVLGIFTIMVLCRDSVVRRYSGL